jgi:hypothetical protein
MDLDAIVQSIDEEIDRLQRLRALLIGHTAPLKRGMPAQERKPVSAESRGRMAAAQKAGRAKERREELAHTSSVS